MENPMKRFVGNQTYHSDVFETSPKAYAGSTT